MYARIVSKKKISILMRENKKLFRSSNNDN